MERSNFFIDKLKINRGVYDFVETSEKDLADIFKKYSDVSEICQAKVLAALQNNNVSLHHFAGSSGYGYGDSGRDCLDKVYSEIFDSQAALVRPHWVSGTHVISDSLFALLRPGDTLLSVTGRPYDTLSEVIGIEGASTGSLREWGVSYKEIPLKTDWSIDLDKVKMELQDQSIRLVFVQRSRGYEWRNSLKISDIQALVKLVKEHRQDVLILVDNCYCEFTENNEPTSVGVDMAVGSLIKNPGGGFAPTGAYAVGTQFAIEKMASRMTSPGIGGEVGSFPYGYTLFFQGLFMAPHIVSQALMGASLFARLFEKLGYKVLPQPNSKRTDIVQSIELRSEEELITFCQSIQASSPVDANAVPYPWDMPGYDHKVIMAAGTFVQGASIELSADAPIKEPYIVYLQGGLTYNHVKFAAMKVLTDMQRKGFINLNL